MTLLADRTCDRTEFLNEFVRNPLDIGAIAPSGRSLTENAIRPVPESGNPLVVEIGPGTGAFTSAIQRRLAGRGHHLAIEINARFVDLLRLRYPDVDVIAADAQNLIDVLATRGHQHADVIVSGLPWSVFGPTRQDDILGCVVDALSPGGTFTMFAYTHMRWTWPARRFNRMLRIHFEEVITGRTIWANIPPAYVLYCRRPRSSNAVLL